MSRSTFGFVVACTLSVAVAAEPAPGLELRPLPEEAAAQTTVAPQALTIYGDGTVARGPVAAEPAESGWNDWSSITAPATDGTYTGTVNGKPFQLTVAGNKVTSWKVENLICPSFTIIQAAVTTSCNIAGNDSFSCGGLGCSAAGNMRISGSFSGNSVSGTFDGDFQPPFASCCSLRGLSFTATRATGGPPAAPTNLTATALADDEIRLTWQDNASNETQFRIEGREGTAGTFIDLGSVAANATGVDVVDLDPATLYQFRVRARNANGDSAYSNVAQATTFGGPLGPCVPSATALCLNNDRFKVQATFLTAQPQSGQAQVVELTPDTGYLWFFSSTNVEAVVKLIDGCSFSNHYWVFAGGLTDVQVVLTVTDHQTGAVKTYTNPLGTKFAPIQDTSAFATCP
jgi:hypothetical protein